MICKLYDCNWALIRTMIVRQASVFVCVCVWMYDADAIFTLFWLTDVASNPIKGISGNKFMMCHHLLYSSTVSDRFIGSLCLSLFACRTLNSLISCHMYAYLYSNHKNLDQRPRPNLFLLAHSQNHSRPVFIFTCCHISLKCFSVFSEGYTCTFPNRTRRRYYRDTTPYIFNANDF